MVAPPEVKKLKKSSTEATAAKRKPATANAAKATSKPVADVEETSYFTPDIANQVRDPAEWSRPCVCMHACMRHLNAITDPINVMM